MEQWVRGLLTSHPSQMLQGHCSPSPGEVGRCVFKMKTLRYEQNQPFSCGGITECEVKTAGQIQDCWPAFTYINGKRQVDDCWTQKNELCINNVVTPQTPRSLPFTVSLISHAHPFSRRSALSSGFFAR